jgi:hypothetical protein
MQVSLASALVGAEWSASRSFRLAPVIIGQEIVWSPGPVRTIWRSENSWFYRDSSCKPSVVQPVESLYTDCVTATTFSCILNMFIKVLLVPFFGVPHFVLFV